jgi:hypothetical protein
VSWVADDRLADVVDDPFGDGVARELALLVELAGDCVVDAGLDDERRQRQIAEGPEAGRRIGLDIGVEEMAHVCLERLDVQLLARVPLDGRAQLVVELDLLPYSDSLGVRVARRVEVLRDRREGAHERCRRLIELHPQRLGLAQRVGVGGIAAERVQVLLHLVWRGHRLAQVAQRLPGLLEPLLSFRQPVLQVDIVLAAIALVGIQLVGVVDRDGLLHFAEQLLEIDDVAVVPRRDTRGLSATVTKRSGSRWNRRTAARFRYEPSVSFNFSSRPASDSASAAASNRPLRAASCRKRVNDAAERSEVFTPAIGKPSQVRP